MKRFTLSAPVAAAAALVCALAVTSCRPSTATPPQLPQPTSQPTEPVTAEPVPDPPPGSLVRIDSGTFTMGSPPAEKDRSPNEGPQTTVTISREFWIGRYEVHIGLFVATSM